MDLYRERHPTLMPWPQDGAFGISRGSSRGEICVFPAVTLVNGPFDIEAGDSIGLLSDGKDIAPATSMISSTARGYTDDPWT